jgi:hypothetical protein
LTGLHPWTRTDRGARPRAYVAVVVLCLALLATLAFVQVAHVHSVDTDADHCSLCIVLHSAATPVAAAVLVIVLVLFQAVAPVVAIRPLGILWHRQLFIRPPPRLSPASF